MFYHRALWKNASELISLSFLVFFGATFRLRLVSNFGDGDCGAGEIHTCLRKISRGLCNFICQQQQEMLQFKVLYYIAKSN